MNSSDHNDDDRSNTGSSLLATHNVFSKNSSWGYYYIMLIKLV